jgi:hypothetical protein
MPICEAANYFKEKILEITPDISTDQLADMVALYPATTAITAIGFTCYCGFDH